MFSPKLFLSSIHSSSVAPLHSTSWASQSSLRKRGFVCNPLLGRTWSSASRETRQPRRHLVPRHHDGAELSHSHKSHLAVATGLPTAWYSRWKSYSCTLLSSASTSKTTSHDSIKCPLGYRPITTILYLGNMICSYDRRARASENGNKTWTGEIGEVARAVQRKTDLQVVLVSPQIPGNTGCIARSCAAAAVGLHLVEPMGFEINSAKLKRAGLDYWPYVVVKVHKSWADFSKYFQQQEGDKRLLAFTKTGNIAHTAVKYRKGDWLLFGSETEGLPDAAIEESAGDKYGGGLVRIPIDETYVRCLNLSVAAGIGIYEALRQLGCTESMMQRPVRDSVPTEREDIFC